MVIQRIGFREHNTYTNKEKIVTVTLMNLTAVIDYFSILCCLKVTPFNKKLKMSIEPIDVLV